MRDLGESLLEASASSIGFLTARRCPRMLTSKVSVDFLGAGRAGADDCRMITTRFRNLGGTWSIAFSCSAIIPSARAIDLSVFSEGVG